jgi:glycosyltransferase involved in cell wall biosynthesis
LGDWFARFDLDLLLLQAPSTIGFESGVPYIMAVHDLQHRLHPEFPEVSAGAEWANREYMFRNGIGDALTVLVDSDVGRDDVLNCYGEQTSAECVQVLPFLPASHPDEATAASGGVAVRDRFHLPERYLFFPAQFWPHKNHLRVVQALAQIRAQHRVDVHVVMCGSAADPLRASVLDKVHQEATDGGVEDLIHILGYVDDEWMAFLYAASRGVVLPTFFGPTNIPILEAWAFGVPVLTSDLRGIREQCGDAAILVDPESVAAIADGLRALWSDDRLRGELVSAGKRRLALYGRAEYVARLSAIIQDATRRLREGIVSERVTLR